MEFKDISTEQVRVYRFAGDYSYSVRNPVRIFVAASGSHRIEDDSGALHYISPGFLAISITLKPGNAGWSF